MKYLKRILASFFSAAAPAARKADRIPLVIVGQGDYRKIIRG
jgi:hypothetical protein